MTQNIRVAVVAATAFAAGFAASHVAVPARADTSPAVPTPAMTPHYYPDLAKLTPMPGATPPFTVRVANASGASVNYLVGTLPSHTHPVANEIQYVISGSGTEQFGNCTVKIQPGTLVVIPHGFGHAGMKIAPGHGPLRILAIKTPPDTAAPGPAQPITCQR
ncbi:MAG TPA: cupin domain-containing protein [Xanthomonadales bacterium]|nr:cupin domain-containing protein [Xanthomonadales bacterium]